MKIAVISDIHGNIHALDAVLADIATQQVDRVVNLGDILSGSLCPFETAERLIPLDFLTIKGNHERQLLANNIAGMGLSDRHALSSLNAKQLDWVRELPDELYIGSDILLVHGVPGSDTTYFLEEVSETGVTACSLERVTDLAEGIQASLILCGHTHIQRSVKLPDGRLIVNPGSVGLQAYDDDLPYYHRMESGSPHARYALVSGSEYNWSVEFKQLSYDWDAAAKIAARNNRLD